MFAFRVDAACNSERILLERQLIVETQSGERRQLKRYRRSESTKYSVLNDFGSRTEEIMRYSFRAKCIVSMLKKATNSGIRFYIFNGDVSISARRK